MVDGIVQEETLHSPFSFERHKSVFVNYFEVVILEDGTIEYAVPSHQEKLIALACERMGCTREELVAKCPHEYWGDYNLWLAMQANAICVWNCFAQGVFNEAQLATLKRCKRERLFSGALPTKTGEIWRGYQLPDEMMQYEGNSNG